MPGLSKLLPSAYAPSSNEEVSGMLSWNAHSPVLQAQSTPEPIHERIKIVSLLLKIILLVLIVVATKTTRSYTCTVQVLVASIRLGVLYRNNSVQYSATVKRSVVLVQVLDTTTTASHSSSAAVLPSQHPQQPLGLKVLVPFSYQFNCV